MTSLKGKKFEDIENINGNMIVQLYTISKRKFQRCFDKEKLTGICLLNAKGTI